MENIKIVDNIPWGEKLAVFIEFKKRSFSLTASGLQTGINIYAFQLAKIFTALQLLNSTFPIFLFFETLLL
jgi:hypothetical protein